MTWLKSLYSDVGLVYETELDLDFQKLKWHSLRNKLYSNSNRAHLTNVRMKTVFNLLFKPCITAI